MRVVTYLVKLDYFLGKVRLFFRKIGCSWVCRDMEISWKNIIGGCRFFFGVWGRSSWIVGIVKFRFSLGGRWYEGDIVWGGVESGMSSWL